MSCWYSLDSSRLVSSQMTTHVPGFQSLFSVLSHFVLAKLVRVKNELFFYEYHCFRSRLVAVVLSYETVSKIKFQSKLIPFDTAHPLNNR